MHQKSLLSNEKLGCEELKRCAKLVTLFCPRRVGRFSTVIPASAQVRIPHMFRWCGNSEAILVPASPNSLSTENFIM